MGLLEPTSGAIVVDDLPIDSYARRRAWQTRIAHVPQSIFLSDGSAAENIAFGLPKAHIDMTRVRAAAQKARIASTIESWSQGYEAAVGERGVRLSGGQRQRIGIARALYKNADVVIFDEATSALDNQTEAEVMEALDNLDRDLTIFLVAHRLTTLRGCDLVVELKDGRVARMGSYEDMIGASARA
jgi:ATP-binding cassette subfamily B protein